MLVLCTSKPHDGLLYYSYEYSILLKCPLIIIPHPGFSEQEYIDAISFKYKSSLSEVYFNEVLAGPTIILGRSMMTLPYLKWNNYEEYEQINLKILFQNVVAVYSENHPRDYPKAKSFFNSNVADIGDTEVYNQFNGIHFEKIINFKIYRKPKNNVQFKYLFMGTNESYYNAANHHINNLEYKDHAIICYDSKYLNPKNNNLIVPIDNVIGLFDTYVYTKETFDPAPRIIQEAKYYNKNIIYSRDESLRDGGYVYYHRDLKEPSIEPILEGIRKL